MHDWNCGIKLFKPYFICTIWSEIAFGFTYFIQGFAFRLEISAVRKKEFHSKITWCCLLDLNRQQFFVYVLCNINTCWHSFLLRKFTIVRPWLSTRWHESMFFSNTFHLEFLQNFSKRMRILREVFQLPLHICIYNIGNQSNTVFLHLEDVQTKSYWHFSNWKVLFMLRTCSCKLGTSSEILIWIALSSVAS